MLTAAVEHHAAALNLDVQSTARGLWLRPKPTAPQTVLDAVGKRHPRPTLPAADECHSLRVIAHTLALHSIKADRGDSECSRPLIWTAQTAALTLAPIGFSHPGSPAALPLGATLTPKNLPF